mmetsp:Transcript_5463/g.9245  ORF Transcript_5463/g.9245 Transcript_5463/m.9245 type:complete len:158 (+) Transcript_5463:477-950(+)
MLNGDGDVDFEFSVSGILSGHSQDVKYLKWNPNKDLLFSASYDNSIKCWKFEESADDWLCEYTIDGHFSTVWQIDFDPTGNYLCSCSEDKTWSIWRVDEKGFQNLGVIAGTHLRSIYCMSWSKINLPQYSLVCTGGSDNRINLFQISSESLQSPASK